MVSISLSHISSSSPLILFCFLMMFIFVVLGFCYCICFSLLCFACVSVPFLRNILHMQFAERVPSAILGNIFDYFDCKIVNFSRIIEVMWVQKRNKLKNHLRFNIIG